MGPIPEATVQEPPKRLGDYYNLNKAWNAAFREVQGELIVSIVDGLWFPPDTLERLWDAYVANPKAMISAVGDQYDQLEHGKPEHRVWVDPRRRDGAFAPCSYTEMELCVASFPTQMILDTGGLDEEWDKYAALSEKELMARAVACGYTPYLDQSLEYRAIKHDRLSSTWEAHYQAGIPYYQQCLKAIADGTRNKLDFVTQTGYNPGTQVLSEHEEPTVS